jgi:cyclopropane-fatty-acyl-phospholipid synthase
MSLFRKALVSRLRNLREGRIVLDGEAHGTPGWLEAKVEVQKARFFASVALGGAAGAGESYRDGDWTCDDLVSLVRILVRNRDVMQGLEGGLARLLLPLRSLAHALRRNSRRGSRRNVADHYDLGNDFFSLFLDETWMYSCAFFERPESTLAEASAAKNERLCRMLALRPRDRLLEIGAGWGGFAIHAASRHGCHVTTTTISREQHAFAVERVRRAGLEGRVTVLLEDWRDLRGRFDRLVSIEMIEAVGHHYLDAWFGKCAELLEPDGLFALQSILIADRFYESARREPDFIKRNVFPGSCIPSMERILRATSRATDFRLLRLEEIGPHYARTLRLWRENLSRNADRARSLGFDDRFLRTWEFYFCYCEGGFLEGHIGDAQMLFGRPRAEIPC